MGSCYKPPHFTEAVLTSNHNLCSCLDKKSDTDFHLKSVVHLAKKDTSKLHKYVNVVIDHPNFRHLLY